MRLLDEQYTRTPFYGVLKMTDALNKQGYAVNPKRVRRLLRQMGLEAIYQKPNLSKPAPGHRIYPYLLRHVVIRRPNQVWSTDITYIRLRTGFIYLVAVMDWFSRCVLSWEISTSLDAAFCCSALEHALRHGPPEIFNTDQGEQFTSEAFTGRLEAKNILISMDGRGRALDNVFVERLWRTVKYEDVYLKDYSDPPDAQRNLRAYFSFYNGQRPHQAQDYQTPEAAYFGIRKKPKEAATRRFLLMSFKGIGKSIRAMESPISTANASPHLSNEFPAGYSLTRCSPAELVSASPAGLDDVSDSVQLRGFLSTIETENRNSTGSDSTLTGPFFCPKNGEYLRFVPD
jgi:putative transposase